MLVILRCNCIWTQKCATKLARLKTVKMEMDQSKEFPVSLHEGCLHCMTLALLTPGSDTAEVTRILWNKELNLKNLFINKIPIKM